MKKTAIIISVLLLTAATLVPAYGETQTPQATPAATSNHQVQEPPPGGDAMIFDLFVLRPLAAASFVIGTGISVLATPFAVATGSTRQTYNALVTQPYDFAFCRPLGEGF
jgi:hypothetical protein